MIDDILKRYSIPSLVSDTQKKLILHELISTIDQNIIGDVVEMGCHEGNTSVLIRGVLDEMNSEKQFHVYDSFQGLPDKGKEDISLLTDSERFTKGYYKCKIECFKENFKKRDLKLPHIHVGWFNEITDNEFPLVVSFAFFDSDFYSSILESFKRVYSRLSIGGIICVHDYDREILPGVSKACKDFLADKYVSTKSENNVLTIKKGG